MNPAAQWRRRILVVEDDDAFRELLRMELRISGFEVIEARDGVAALRCVEKFSPDVVILDLQLPAAGGLDVRQELLTRPDTRDVPVIVVTGTDWSVPFPTAAVIRKTDMPSRIVTAVTNVLEAWT